MFAETSIVPPLVIETMSTLPKDKAPEELHITSATPTLNVTDVNLPIKCIDHGSYCRLWNILNFCDRKSVMNDPISTKCANLSTSLIQFITTCP
ncbi:hypothetical protein KIN20_006748 [Parelaphostrongylus tenuis]|uniref:Uncharacterized protein n=1 Tax=Parelaphostrongylus tenuis TaxID=148309 RepID=A0AAD5M281_PARTN|nr:hypothetical protein KIN20_006748 [Parelaphostrongylus tenuis]